MQRIHIIGGKNHGKTQLVVELTEEFVSRGLRVGTIKHTHHHHELDIPGKDSHRHREAGSAAVGILSKGMNAIFWPQPEYESAVNKYEPFDVMMDDCDVVLVEGDSQANAPKIEVYRMANGNLPIAASDTTIHAVVTDDVLDIETITWKRSDVKSVVDNVESLLKLKPEKNWG